MSASFALPQIEDGLEKLLLIASLKKEDIAANAAEVRKQAQLTNEELGKVAEAKAYIAQHVGLAAELKGREDVLTDTKVKHDLDKKQFDLHVASENTRLETFAAQLTAREKELTEASKKQMIEADRLRGLGIDQTRQHQEAMSAVQAQQANNNAAVQINATEAERLKNWESTLKKKAQSLREQAANF